MNIVSIFLLALAMSADAFAAAIGKGAMLHRPRLIEALRTGIIFGAIEAITPLVGWSLGRVAADYVTAWDHWIAFIILSALGIRMIWSGFKPDPVIIEKPRSHSFILLAATALGTSIDAMSVGVSLAFLDVDIVPVAVVIGIVTCVMVSIGVMLGRMLGSASKHTVEILGGLILIGIGSLILYKHLYGAG